MKNFLRALRFAYPNRFRLGISFGCALFAAALWSLNFTAIYPILKIFGTGQNLQTWVNGAIKETQEKQIDPAKKRMDELHEELIAVKKEPEGHPKDTKERKLNASMQAVEATLTASRRDLYILQVAKRFLDNHCPTDKFETLFAVLLLVVLAVVLRGIFEFWQESLVGGVVSRALFTLRNRFFRRTIHLDVNSFGETGTHRSEERRVGKECRSR